MSESKTPETSDGGDAVSFLEKLADLRVLVLVLAMLFYLDIWLIRAGVDPTAVTLDQLSERVKQVPIYNLALFALSFSLLVGAAFPALRKVIGLLRIYLPGRVSIGSGRTKSRQRLSDWSLAFVCLSAYDAVAGLLSPGNYRGLALNLGDLINADGWEATAFRLVAVVFWLSCLAFAIEVEDPFNEA